MTDADEKSEKEKRMEILENLEAQMSRKKWEKERIRQEEDELERRLEKSSELNITAVIPAYKSSPPDSQVVDPITVSPPASSNPIISPTTDVPAPHCSVRKAPKKGRKNDGAKNLAPILALPQKRAQSKKSSSHPKPDTPPAKKSKTVTATVPTVQPINLIPYQPSIPEMKATFEREKENIKRKIRADIESNLKAKFRREMSDMHLHYQAEVKKAVEHASSSVTKLAFYVGLLKANDIKIPEFSIPVTNSAYAGIAPYRPKSGFL